MKQFSLTQLFLFTTWCGIAFFAISRYFATSPYQGRFEDIEAKMFYHKGSDEELEVTTFDEAMVRKAPVWSPADPNPPVSARMALSIAERIRAERFDDKSNWRWYLTSLTLYPLDGKNHKWCWCVLFTGYPKAGGLGGMPPQFAAYILMNGEVVLTDEPEEVFGILPSSTDE